MRETDKPRKRTLEPGGKRWRVERRVRVAGLGPMGLVGVSRVGGDSR